MKRISLAAKLQAVEEHFRSELKVSRTQATHPGAQGADIEDRWISLFSYYLPGKYKVGRAFVVDSKGGTSDQIDCVVYDAVHTPALYGKKEGLYIPAEAVYAVFEVKPKLEKKHIEYAVDKAESVRKLHRQYACITDKGQKHPPRSEVKIVGGLLTGCLGVSAKKAQAHFSKSQLDIALSVGENAATAACLDRFDVGGKIQCKSGKGALMAGLFRLLSNLQEAGTVGAIDFSSYEKSAQ